MSHRAIRILLNPICLLFVLVVEHEIISRRRAARPRGQAADRREPEMHDRLAGSAPQATDVIARAVGAVALATLAMIHVVDLPGTLGPLPLVGAGYLGIIAAAVMVGGMMIARSHWLVW